MNILDFKNRILSEYLETINIITDNGSILLKNMPDIAKYAYLHSFYKGLGSKDIDLLSNELQLPEELVFFYRNFNGLEFFCGALYMYGLRKDNSRTVLATIQQPYDILLPNGKSYKYYLEGVIYIGAYKAGNVIVGYVRENGSIIKQEKSNGKILNRWDGLASFLEQEYDRLSAERERNK